MSCLAKCGIFQIAKHRALTVSNHPCPACQKGLIRRKAAAGKGKVRYYWTCSGYPDCETSIFDKAGKPNFATARTITKAPEE